MDQSFSLLDCEVGSGENAQLKNNLEPDDMDLDDRDDNRLFHVDPGEVVIGEVKDKIKLPRFRYQMMEQPEFFDASLCR